MTVLYLVAAADRFGLSVYEGFSVPASDPQPTPSVELGSVADSQPFVDVPGLAAMLIHPPGH
mgnify:CR=1 FL=1